MIRKLSLLNENMPAMSGKIFVICVILLLLDGLYIFSMKNTFERQIIRVQRVVMKLRLEGVFVCYALLAFGLYYFILRQRRTTIEAFMLGIVIYGVYDSTNYATLKHWGSSFAFIDTLWGGILFATATTLYYSIGF